MTNRKDPMRIAIAALAGFIATIFAANWLIATFGVVTVAPGLLAPAGVFAAGLAFTFRDIVHRQLGPWWTMGAIVIGAACSYMIEPRFAVASAIAFLTSEFADLAVYAPLERRTTLGALTLSNTVGLLIDSWLFLTHRVRVARVLLGPGRRQRPDDARSRSSLLAVWRRAVLPRYAQA
jgi:uncharacterized PurR-regulated membrane protein YhhQ (DUF165 family)